MKDQSLLVRYPIGMFEYGKEYSNLDTLRHIREIADLPKKLKKIVKKLREGALDKTYRQHGWTVRQVVHHLADSHINAYVRMKLAVTENAPIVKPYEEQLWAETEDGKHGSAGMSLKLLSALHKRWVFFLSHLSDEDLDKVYYNPSSKRTIQLREAIALYAWHGKHHLAHVKLVADGNKKHEAGDTDVVEVKAKRMPKSGNAGTVTGKVVKEASGETEAPKRRGRPPLTKPAAKPVRQKKGTKVVIDSVQDTVSTTAEEVVVEKTAVAATAGKTAKTRTAKSARVEEASSDKPRRGRPAVKKSASEAVVVPPSNVEEASSDKPRRGRPAVKKSASEAVVVPPSNVEEASSDKPRRGRPAVKKAATPEKPKRSRRTPEEIAAAKEKKG